MRFLILIFCLNLSLNIMADQATSLEQYSSTQNDLFIDWAAKKPADLAGVAAADNWPFNNFINNEESQETSIEDSANSISSEYNPPFFVKHKLLFFFASTCPYCHQFAPTLKNVAKRFNAEISAYSFDDKALTAFPDFSVPPIELVTAAFQDREINYPALFILNEETKGIYPVSFGFLDSIELTERLNIVKTKIEKFEENI